MKYLLAFVISVVTAIIVGKILIPILEKKHIGQEILGYVTLHETKKGTPTLGGIIFVAAVLLAYLLFSGAKVSLTLFALSVALGSMLVGFLDDFIKLRFGRNLGLYPYQKIVAQLVLATALSVYAYLYVGSSLFVPFLAKWVDFGFFSLPLYFVAFIALTNTVNLTDGLDGLCASTSICYLVGLLFLFALSYFRLDSAGYMRRLSEIDGLIFLDVSLIGGLLGFLFFNAYPAKIFMGDTGSLFIGAMLSALTILGGFTLFILTFGVVFVISGLSDIIQVCYFKITHGKRVFLMAPFHHHLQEKGMHENKIVVLYVIITLFGVCASIINLVG